MSISEYNINNTTNAKHLFSHIKNRRIIGDIVRLTFSNGTVCECKLTDWNIQGLDAPIIIAYSSVKGVA